MGRAGLKVLAGTFAEGMGRELGTWCLDFWGVKECSPVRRGGKEVYLTGLEGMKVHINQMPKHVYLGRERKKSLGISVSSTRGVSLAVSSVL